jgi:hypothetical protein
MKKEFGKENEEGGKIIKCWNKGFGLELESFMSIEVGVLKGGIFVEVMFENGLDEIVIVV